MFVCNKKSRIFAASKRDSSLAQLVRASDCESEGPWFKSKRGSKNEKSLAKMQGFFRLRGSPYQIFTLSFGAIYNLSLGLMLNALYQPSIWATPPLTRKCEAECTSLMVR